MAEIWKQINGIAGYQISSLGQVRLGDLGMPRTLSMNRAGYLVVSIGGETHLVSRLVCRAFHGDPPTAKHMAAHINGTNNDNRAENLAWKTAWENAQDRKLHAQIKHNLTRIKKEKSKKELVWKNPFDTLPPTEQDWLDYDEKVRIESTRLCVNIPVNDTAGKAIAESIDQIEKPTWRERQNF